MKDEQRSQRLVRLAIEVRSELVDHTRLRSVEKYDLGLDVGDPTSALERASEVSVLSEKHVSNTTLDDYDERAVRSLIKRPKTTRDAAAQHLLEAYARARVAFPPPLQNTV